MNADSGAIKPVCGCSWQLKVMRLATLAKISGVKNVTHFVNRKSLNLNMRVLVLSAKAFCWIVENSAYWTYLMEKINLITLTKTYLNMGHPKSPVTKFVSEFEYEGTKFDLAKKIVAHWYNARVPCYPVVIVILAWWKGNQEKSLFNNTQATVAAVVVEGDTKWPRFVDEIINSIPEWKVL